MKRLYISVAVLSLCGMSAMAQETYENTRLVDNDLNGTARYVGMGGAMEALGADVSTMSTNPAGVGLFRKSKVDLSFGLVSQQDATKFNSLGKTNASFDQIGFVYVLNKTSNSGFNIGFNYHKSRNFDQILGAANTLNNASQNKLTYQKYRNKVFTDKKSMTYNQIDGLYMDNLLYNKNAGKYYNYPATGYLYNEENMGYIGEYDVSLSGNINNRIYLGMTIGLHDVHYRNHSEYTENFVANADKIPGLTLNDNREITGTGYDVKFGAIFRPFDANAFRVGVYMNTPTWYDLTTSNYSTMTDGTTSVPTHESYDFRVDTPWKFGLSLGHTINNVVALGATYEYADYSAMSTRIKDGGYYDNWYGTYYENSHKDKAMNAHTQETLKGVHTLKLGAEFKVMPEWSVRLGYNYLSALFNENGAKNGTIASPGSYYASSTSFVNWKATNRITCGVGYAHKNFNVDLAYQYSAQNGEYFPFANYYEGKTPSNEDNIATATKVNNKRHQLLLTLGYRF